MGPYGKEVANIHTVPPPYWRYFFLGTLELLFQFLSLSLSLLSISFFPSPSLRLCLSPCLLLSVCLSFCLSEFFTDLQAVAEFEDANQRARRQTLDPGIGDIIAGLTVKTPASSYKKGITADDVVFKFKCQYSISKFQP